MLCSVFFLFLQIIKALNLYRKKTGSEKHFWVWINFTIFFLFFYFGYKHACFFILTGVLHSRIVNLLPLQYELQKWRCIISDITLSVRYEATWHFKLHINMIILLCHGVHIVLCPISVSVAVLFSSLYSCCWQIHLDKRVPSGAGLGGGSSNAATALWAANQFSGCIATEQELQEWSSEIGSDVPFFFSQGAAYCTGRGEVSPTIRFLPLSQNMIWENPPNMLVMLFVILCCSMGVHCMLPVINICLVDMYSCYNGIKAMWSFMLSILIKLAHLLPFCGQMQLLIVILFKIFLWFVQVVQNIPPPIPLDTPMVLMKPQQACPTAAVYKVWDFWV